MIRCLKKEVVWGFVTIADMLVQIWQELLCLSVKTFLSFCLFLFSPSSSLSLILDFPPSLYFLLLLLSLFSPSFLFPLPFLPLFPIALLFSPIYSFSLPLCLPSSLLSSNLSLCFSILQTFSHFHSFIHPSDMSTPGFQAPPPPPPALCPQRQPLPRPLIQSRLPTVGWLQQGTVVDFPVTTETQRLQRTLTDLPFTAPITTHSL